MSPLLPVCGFKASLCVRSKRPRVYRHHAHMFEHMCAWCWHTRRKCPHGGVLEAKYVFFHVFSHQTHTTNTNNTTTTTTHTTQHNTQHHTERQRRRERERQRETERERERERGGGRGEGERERKRERQRETERQRKRENIGKTIVQKLWMLEQMDCGQAGLVQEDIRTRMKAGESLVDLMTPMTSTMASMVDSLVAPLDVSLVASMASMASMVEALDWLKRVTAESKSEDERVNGLLMVWLKLSLGPG